MKRVVPSMSMLMAFDAVARCSSFSRAAAQLNLTQAAVSYRIRILEEQLGAELFSRTNRSVSLTAAGRRYWIEIGQALETIENASSRLMLAGPRKERTQFHLLAMQAVASLWLLPRMPKFQKLNPDLKVMLVSWIGGSDRIDRTTFAQQDLDAAILYTLPSTSSPGVVKEPLVPDFAVPVCSPSLAARNKPLRTPQDLKHHTILHAINWPNTWQAWLKAAGASGVQPKDEVYLQHTAMTIDAALQGMGVALAHAPLIHDHLKSKRLITPFRKLLAIDHGYYLLYPSSNRDNAAVRIFGDWLRVEFGRGTSYLESHYSIKS